MVFEIARDIAAFLRIEAGVTRPENVPGSGSIKRGAEGLDAALREELEASRRQAARKDKRIEQLEARLGAPYGLPGQDVVRPENLVWIFGSGRTGSTWLSRMMGDLEGHYVWFEPSVGGLFGNCYYDARSRQQASKNFVLGDRQRATWLKSIRSFVLEGADGRFPEAGREGYLVIKEPNGSTGAPLMMEALPESRQIFLVRDPRDVVASTLDAHREGSWSHGWGQDTAKQDAAANESPDEFVRRCANMHYQRLERAWQAYEEHRGTKFLVRYEDLQVDTLGTMKRVYSELGIPASEGALSDVVQKHSWESLPDEKKGEGKFYRKGTPGSWRDDLTPEQAGIVEEITAPL